LTGDLFAIILNDAINPSIQRRYRFGKNKRKLSGLNEPGGLPSAVKRAHFQKAEELLT
jgi:hypothetical protein